jgi:PPE-repeat protein
MSFLTSPPEILSSLLYSGPGAAPMLTAAASWDGLAGELGTAAQSFSSVTSGLAGQAWQGPASAAMMQTATRYAGYLTQAATHAQTAAAQAQAVASAYEATMAATVHPLAVAANRNEFVQLVVSNLFGQNAPAIAAAESNYEQMWAQDVAAMVGYHGGASAAVSQLPSWSAAIQGLPAEAAAAIAGTPGAALSSVPPAVSGPLTSLLGTVEHYASNVINAPTEVLFGRQLIPTQPQVSLGGSSATGKVPLTVFGGSEPLVNASVGTGAPVPLLVDTGSAGLVIPFTEVGGLTGLLQLGLPLGLGISGYSGGLDYVYATYNAPVNFGGGLVTPATPVNIELFAFPTNLSTLVNNGFTFQSFFASDGAAGVLGVGPNATGPGPSIPTQALPGTFGQGLLINQPDRYLQFGAQPGLDGWTAGPVLHGSPITNLEVKVGSVLHQNVPSIIDSGGVQGTLPTGLNAQPGDIISVFAPDNPNTPLYSFKYNGDYSPVPISSGLMNTGNRIFQNHPVYISYAGRGSSTIYGP